LTETKHANSIVLVPKMANQKGEIPLDMGNQL